MLRYLAFALWLSSSALPAQTPIKRIWLTHQSHDPSHIVINWETAEATRSVLHYGETNQLGNEQIIAGSRTLHQVEIPIQGRDKTWHYQVGEEHMRSRVYSFKGYPSKNLRVALVGDWGYAPQHDLSPLVKDNVHLIITAGDNVASLHEKGKEGIKAFSAFIDRYPDIFRSTPLMPILGNHDREITPRGDNPPEHAVYDVSASAYREFFALPGDEWIWHFDIPDFGFRFMALDLNHISDFGTTWQTCHAFDKESPQFRWFKVTMHSSDKFDHVITLMNERQLSVKGKTKGIWHDEFIKGSALISGFGYFAERAELEGGLPYFNTCLKGDGAPYKDPNSRFFAQEHHYLLLSATHGDSFFTMQFKNLKGQILDTIKIPKRRRNR